MTGAGRPWWQLFKAVAALAAVTMVVRPTDVHRLRARVAVVEAKSSMQGLTTEMHAHVAIEAAGVARDAANLAARYRRHSAIVSAFAGAFGAAAAMTVWELFG